MSHLLDDDDLMPRRERELTLSTGSILGIFFGLVLVCGLFFAFGYNMGKKATLAPIVSSNGESESVDGAQFDKFKPSAGSPAGTAPTLPAPAQNSAPVASNAPAGVAPSTKSPASEASAPSPAAETASSQARPSAAPVNLSTPAHPNAPVPAAAMPAVSATGSYVVQVAAVSHHEDADLLVGALRSKGYSVTARPEPQDKLLHIQVGPFANKKDADAMRQRLLGDGYNAIVK